MDNIVVVDGAPVIDASKKERLVTKICKDFGKKGVHVKADNIFMPWDDKAGKSKGCVSLPHSPTAYSSSAAISSSSSATPRRLRWPSRS